MNTKKSAISILEVLIAGIFAIVFIANGILHISPSKAVNQNLEDAVLPLNGILLPVQWGNLGKQLVENGVIDEKKFGNALYLDNKPVTITQENSGVILNLLWALGLSNKNDILDTGPMQNYGNIENFASTGGWTLAKGRATDHYSKHQFIVLTPEQQQLVERVSKGIYRPCCNNSTYFPDCNHGMAMLGLLELMASQGISEEKMYATALQVNSYWFPDTYMAIATYLEQKGINWDKASPKEILGANFSSASGYQKILEQITPPSQKNKGGSCGV